ncbi:MAG: UDP-N-acetylmuramate--L-alanine ligase [Candidatus Vogelbacteria bacterium]|nr:UDP-N-acetylmuramate--L-alanine ligase [Candidatus Vogelbacteria bacterium]
MTIDLKKTKKVYFIGIGGIGMSAIARMLALRSFSEAGLIEVIGSDRASSLVTQELEKLGIKIFYEQKAENITSDIGLVIYTIAIPEDNPELKKARELGIKCLTYPEMLGVISADKYTIAISGTNGKTTTTAMVAKIMIEAGLDPTVIVGSLIKPEIARPGLAENNVCDAGTNFIAGQSKYFVVEACEYQRSFLNLAPKILVITNIDNDHLDYYKDLADIQSAFIELATKLPADGFLVCDKNDPLLLPVIKATKAEVIDYKSLSRIENLLVPGEHNIKDAQASLGVAQALKINQSEAIKSLEKFVGAWRRFEFKGKMMSGALIYDDYAHNPTKILAAINGARDFMTKNNLSGRLIVAFQPHLYSRTKTLKDEFAQALAEADEIILAPIYAAREPNDPEISSDILADLIKTKNPQVFSLSGLTEVVGKLKKDGQAGDLIITMGAGDIYKTADDLVEN